MLLDNFYSFLTFVFLSHVDPGQLSSSEASLFWIKALVENNRDATANVLKL